MRTGVSFADILRIAFALPIVFSAGCGARDPVVGTWLERPYYQGGRVVGWPNKYVFKSNGTFEVLSSHQNLFGGRDNTKTAVGAWRRNGRTVLAVWDELDHTDGDFQQLGTLDSLDLPSKMDGERGPFVKEN